MMQQRLYSDAQKQLFLYQREIVAGRTAAATKDKPTSPKLAPLCSPGPVTPLELEDEAADNYLDAGARKAHRDRHQVHAHAHLLGESAFSLDEASPRSSDERMGRGR